MNRSIFNGIAAREYKRTACTFSQSEVLKVFHTFFDAYRKAEGKEHPHVKPEQIRKIIERMPKITDRFGRDIDLNVETYAAMIDNYFNTDSLQCDYRINHFFSGDIRLMCLYASGCYC